VLTTNLNTLVSDKDAIVSVSDGLLSTWNTVQDIINVVENRTLDIFGAAEDVLDLFDKCAGVGSQYLKLKDTICGDIVEGAASIAMSGFFIGICGLAVIFILGAMVQGLVFDD
jgi:hypothetical protein